MLTTIDWCVPSASRSWTALSSHQQHTLNILGCQHKCHCFIDSFLLTCPCSSYSLVPNTLTPRIDCGGISHLVLPLSQLPFVLCHEYQLDIVILPPESLHPFHLFQGLFTVICSNLVPDFKVLRMIEHWNYTQFTTLFHCHWSISLVLDKLQFMLHDLWSQLSPSHTLGGGELQLAMLPSVWER